MQVYEAMVRGLEDLGVRTAFGGNGENIAGLTLALSRSDKIRPILTRHEGGAAYMAGGYAMFTRELGVCFATVGPGAFNLVTGLGVAMSDSYPLLAITGYIDQRMAGRGGVNDTSGLNGAPDSQALFAATTKRSYLLTDPGEVCDVLEEAVNLAFDGRPGPVHVAVAQHLADDDIEVEYRRPVLRTRPPQPDPAEVATMADALAAALREDRKVLVLVGFGAVRSQAHDEVLAFVERFGFPLVATLDGKGIIREDHPLYRGVFSESGHSSGLDAFKEADVVLAIGNSLNQHATFGLREDLFEGKSLLQVNIFAGDIGRFYEVDAGVVADAAPAVTALSDALAARVPDHEPGRSSDDEGLDWDVGPLAGLAKNVHPGRMTQVIGRLLPPGGVVLADAGAHLAWLGYHVALEEGQAFHKCGAFGPMAANTIAAIGVKAAEPHRTVVVGCGDGCYAMSGFELMTAVENDLPVIWVIYNDGEFKLVKLYQLATFTRTGLVDLQPPDFAAFARACGADGHSVDSLEEFEEVYAAALASRRPTVIDVKIARWALPRYTASPEGPLHGAWEMIRDRFSPWE